MKAKNNVALKEWAVVNRALREGRQTILLRKGDIYDVDGAFEVKEKEFFIYPTSEHQNAESLQPPYRFWIENIRDPRKVEFSVYGVADEVMEIKNLSALSALKSVSVWSDVYFQKRIEYKPEKPLFLIFVRCYQILEPLVIDVTSHYEGCVSWVDMERPSYVRHLQPVLSDEEFAAQKQQVLNLLS